jgi:hypothetical protein
MPEVRARAAVRPKLMSVLSSLLVVAGFFGLAVIGVLLYGQCRTGLDYHCTVTMLPIPLGSDPDATPVGSFSWLPLGVACDYPQIVGDGWAARHPGWDLTISALIAILMVLTGALKLLRQRRLRD